MTRGPRVPRDPLALKVWLEILAHKVFKATRGQLAQLVLKVKLVLLGLKETLVQLALRDPRVLRAPRVIPDL